MRVEKGKIRACFAFDIGHEVSLERLRQIAEFRPVPPLSRKKQTPTHLQYTIPPLILPLGPAPAFHPGESSASSSLDAILGATGTTTATIFDFGALSISYQWEIASAANLALADLPILSLRLHQQDLEIEARATVTRLLDTLAPAISRPGLDALVEDYYLFILEELESEPTGETLLNLHRTTLAQTLRFEVQPLSRMQQEEALSQRVSYYEHDLALIDWNAAIIYDRDYEDSANVLEFLNVELLEARYVDAQLDRRLLAYSPLPPPSRFGLLPFRVPYRKQIEELAELKAEFLLLNERVDNSLKLIGDLYLALLHTAAARRFYLHEWNLIIARKLEIINDLYEMMTDRIQVSQSQILELIIIVLILVELVIGLTH
jgi:hypothetical protein